MTDDEKLKTLTRILRDLERLGAELRYVLGEEHEAVKALRTSYAEARTASRRIADDLGTDV
jgi:hypothetical protein